MIFLLGRQAMLGQEPPTYFRSITATCFPCLASVQAMYLEPSPLPSTTTSYSSGCGIGICIVVVSGHITFENLASICIRKRIECFPGLSRTIHECLGHWFEDKLFLIVHNDQVLKIGLNLR